MTQKAKGSAEAATSTPSRVQTPSKGLRNMVSNNTNLQHAAIDSDWNLNSANCYFSSNSMLNHSLRELHALQDAITTIENVICGFESQPRFEDPKSKNFNKAGRNLETLADFFHEISTLIVNTAKSAIPNTVSDAEYQSWILLRSEVKYCENIHDFAKLSLEQSMTLVALEGGAA